MRVSVSKQSPAPKGESAAAPSSEKSTFVSTSGIGSVLHLQRTVRNRAVIQRQPPPQGQGQGGSSGMDPKFWEWWKAVQGFEGSLAGVGDNQVHAQQAIARADGVVKQGVDADSKAKSVGSLDLQAVIGRIERRQAGGFVDENDEKTMTNLKGQVLGALTRVMDLGS